ncbi:hypothetical protein [Ensifer sp. YR511]|uniref:hypothetical protein n=1 Tax=Ensifer sp. YR511 TaxID=1855294 RepID=UPI00088B8401|nr:hypothetical protein [Ensifer sp. YR511]SDN71236.1 hypothetical protein SAMN05216328_13427 [Ensifer sp. YR511]
MNENNPHPKNDLANPAAAEPQPDHAQNPAAEEPSQQGKSAADAQNAPKDVLSDPAPGNASKVDPVADAAPLEPAVTPPPPINPELKRAADDVRILYSYLAREAKLSEDELTEPVETYAELPDRILDQKRHPTYTERAKLWTVLSELTALAKPATPDSIRNSYYGQVIDGVKEGRSSNDKLIRPIWITGVIGFSFTLLLGLYVSFTERIVTDTTARIGELTDILTNNYRGTRLERVASQAVRVTPAPDPTPQGAEAVTRQADQPADIAADEPSSPMSLSVLEDLKLAAVSAIDREITHSFQVLEYTTFGLGRDSRRQVGDLESSISKPKNETGDPVLASSVALTETLVGATGEYSVFGLMPLNWQRYINHTISAYILPAIASLLGAVVSILRDAQRRMESVSLSPRRAETYWPSIILAVIAGAVIGWLSGQDTSGVFAKISPAAASFVIGYSTEILFRILDSIKQALGVPDQLNVPERGAGK